MVIGGTSMANIGWFGFYTLDICMCEGVGEDSGHGIG